MNDIPAIEVSNLNFSYEKIPVLRNVNISIKQGDYLGVIGPNGGGKTTLVKLLLGILKPDNGEIKILGEPPLKKKHRMGYVPQNTNLNITFPVSVTEVILMGCLNSSSFGIGYKRHHRDKVEKILQRLGLWELRNNQIGKLSGGQRQRVLIARALAADPEILFLDEPTASVDSEFEKDLYNGLKELNRTTTIVVVTHDLGVISRNMKSLACVNRELVFHEDGKISEEMIDMAYLCPVDLVSHGIPHRVLAPHED